MAKVLISGGTGFVGYWLRKTQPSFVQAEYLSQWSYKHAGWGEENWDCIIHAAHIPPSQVLRVAKFNCAHMLYISSGAAYFQNTEYANNKRKWEQECLNSGADVVIARLFTFYGERLDDGKAITQFIKAARCGAPLRIWGDGNTVRSYMYGGDMARWLWTILLRGQTGEIYDVGDDRPVTMLELSRMVNKAFGNKSQIVIENKPEVMPYYMPHNMEKTKRLLNTI